MTDEILPYYNRELSYIQDLAAEFAEQHPEEAAGLRISAGNIDDPHVERLIQAFALLCARIRFKLDDDFPELTDSLLGHLYPHYLSPVPSMAIVQLAPAPELDGYYTIPPKTEIETESIRGENVSCRYRTCYPVVLRPIEVASAALTGLPLDAPSNTDAVQRDAIAVLRLTLACVGPNKSFKTLAKEWAKAPTSALRFFLRAPRPLAFPLYELLFNHTVSVAIGASSKDRNPVILEPKAVRPVGFEPDEGMVPYGPRSFIGYRLLTEYFTFPEKFLFFDLEGLTPEALAKGDKTLDIFFYLNRSDPDVEKRVDGKTFILGCTPIVNLFNQRAENISLTQTAYEYPVHPDRRKPRAYEIYSIDNVVASEGKRQVSLKPFFATSHVDLSGTPGPFWHLSRRQSVDGKDGTEVFLSFVDLKFNPTAPAGWIVSVDATCLNRDLPNQIPFGGGQPRIDLVEGASEIAGVECLTPPTQTLRLPGRNGARWRLMSHLNLNHLSLCDDGAEAGAGAEALREMLRLYAVRDNEATRRSIESIKKVHHGRGVARVPYAGSDAFYHGVDIDIEFDRNGFPGGGMYLLASVLERFLGTACSINAFTRLTVRCTNQEDVLKTWPPRAGDLVLL